MSDNFLDKDFRGHSFKRQDLSGADFSYIDIRGANFRKAILRNANFSHAICGMRVPKLIFFIEVGLMTLTFFLFGISNDMANVISAFSSSNPSFSFLEGGNTLKYFLTKIMPTIRPIADVDYWLLTITIFLGALLLYKILITLKPLMQNIPIKISLINTSVWGGTPATIVTFLLVLFSRKYLFNVFSFLYKSGLYRELGFNTSMPESNWIVGWIISLLGFFLGIFLFKITPKQLLVKKALIVATSGVTVTFIILVFLMNDSLLPLLAFTAILSFIVLFATECTSFKGADLTNATFTRAKIGCTDFSKAKLKDTSFEGAKM
ncbi:pentapeptide repeat-containing protein [Lyngbya aestuarii]|uniref:pentapeptide repeat-containing protein n=1 Tax=Lyngbya aestuarii TaxID=118322 RepID=UPI00403E10B7